MAKRRLKWFYDEFFGYKLLRDASRVIALTQIEAQQYKNMDVPESKIEIIPNGIDLSEYCNLPIKGSFRNRFAISNDKKIVLYVGRLHQSKGIDFLIRSYAFFVNSAKNHNSKLVIAGPDDGFMSHLRKLTSERGINANVIFTGLLPEHEKIAAFVDADIVVNVEPKNVFGMVPLEAAACSKPVIVSEGNAIKDAVLEGNFGLVARYGDIKQLAGIMEKALEDVEKLIEMGKNGRKFVERNFNWANIIKKVEEVYLDAMITIENL
jgi:glycosyltransferase involved in cell wall biosynthesis